MATYLGNYEEALLIILSWMEKNLDAGVVAEFKEALRAAKEAPEGMFFSFFNSNSTNTRVFYGD